MNATVEARPRLLTFSHWRDVESGDWRWPNFSPQELACRGTGRLALDVEAMNKLQRLRTILNRPMIVTSGYRSAEHNTRVGGASRSFHMQGCAFDVSMSNHDPAEFERAARRVGFTGIIRYPKSGFIHIDTRPSPFDAGPRFPARETRFEPEVEPVEKLANSRIATGGGIAAGGAGIVIADKAMDAVGGKAEQAVEQIADQIIGGLSAGSIVAIVAGALLVFGVGRVLYARWDDAGRPSLREIFRSRQWDD